MKAVITTATSYCDAIMGEQFDLFERWLPVVGYEGKYEVSDWGRVRSIARKGTPGGLLRLRPNHKGYLRAQLVDRRPQCSHFIHKIVLTAFVGEKPADYVADHIDGDRQNNHLLNLRWVTPKQNVEASRQRLGEWRTSEQAKQNWQTRKARYG